MTHALKEPLAHLITKLETIVPYAAALYKKSSGTRVNVNAVQESVEPQGPSQGLVFSLWNGQTMFEYAVNQWDWKQLESDLLAFAATIPKTKPSFDINPGPTLVKDFTGPLDSDPATIPLQEKLNQARGRVKDILKMDKQVTNVVSVLGDVTHEDLFVNRTNVISQKITRSDLILMLFISDGKKTAEIFQGLSKNGGYEKVNLPESVIKGLIADGKKVLHAERLKPGVYDTVTDPEWSGIIAHECFGHGMETDLYVRERALSQQYLGKQIAAPIVNMFDDPANIHEAGGFFFDDEGQLSTPTHIIKDGILQRGLTDLASAHKLKMKRSANGRRESYARKAYARMTNTYFDNGKSTKEDMISAVNNGLYLRYATNGMEDPQAWGIQVEGLWAEEIKNGKLTGKVYSPVIMTGFVPDLLKSITMVGNDRHISGLGMCGKGHKEWVKNTTGGPHLRMTARLG